MQFDFGLLTCPVFFTIYVNVEPKDYIDLYSKDHQDCSRVKVNLHPSASERAGQKGTQNRMEWNGM